MHINGTSPLPSTAAAIRPAITDPRTNAARQPTAAPAAPSAAAPVSAGEPKGRAVPVEAPPGTDPELWSILTADERAFFASTAAMGPLTYRRVMSPDRAAAPPVARGGRLDVRG